MERVLINTGPSERGWHRLEAFLRCQELYAWGYGHGGRVEEALKGEGEPVASRFPPSAPLVRGSIGHAGLAHVYSRQRATQRGEDPDRYYKPLAAMELVAATFGELGAGMLPIAARAVKAYCEHYSSETAEVISIEEQEETEFFGCRYTARVDRKFRDRSGKIWYEDHKFVGRIESKVARRYVLSGQVLGMIHLGSRRYEDQFGGVRLNLIGCNSLGFARIIPEPAPYQLAKFPYTVKYAEEGIQRLEELIREGEPPPASPSEHTCMTSYGECPAFELCRWGGRAIISLGGSGGNGEK